MPVCGDRIHGQILTHCPHPNPPIDRCITCDGASSMSSISFCMVLYIFYIGLLSLSIFLAFMVVLRDKKQNSSLIGHIARVHMQWRRASGTFS
jgi:hypothetical protein